MNLKMIQLKNETKNSVLSITKTVKRLFNKLKENQKKLWKLNLTNREKHSISIHLYRLKDLGRLVPQI